MKYPIGTVFVRDNPLLIKSWKIINILGGNKYLMQHDTGGTNIFDFEEWYDLNNWRVEYPKEVLFDKLYLTLKADSSASRTQ